MYADRKSVFIDIQPENVRNLRKWFDAYVASFNTGDSDFQKNITLKDDHSRCVCREIRELGSQIGLFQNELLLCEVIGLFHDVGRFDQYARFQTFADMLSVNHAELGVEILKENKVLCCFPEELKDLIFRIISYHNLADLPLEETTTCLFYTRLLRDADKLDIWRVVTEYYSNSTTHSNRAIELSLPDTNNISREVYEDIMNRQIVDVRHIKNINDFKLLQVGWVYDINFLPTLEKIRDRRYLEKINAVLTDSVEVKEIFSAVESYLYEKLKDNMVQLYA
ncbi:MAG: HD domain-containing protein [Deltaproteobacteria bacterium]|nr:HD domain-containing protein [Deltaproteobacteria bacterium]